MEPGPKWHERLLEIDISSLMSGESADIIGENSSDNQEFKVKCLCFDVSDLLVITCDIFYIVTDDLRVYYFAYNRRSLLSYPLFAG